MGRGFRRILLRSQLPTHLFLKVQRKNPSSRLHGLVGLMGMGLLLVFAGCGGGGGTQTLPPPGQRPIAVAGGPYAADATQTITFDGSKSSDPASLALTYTWNFGDGAVGTGVKPTHAYSTPGPFSVSLTVINSKGISSPSAQATVTISPLPVANAGGPYAADVGQSLTLNSSQSTGGSGALAFAWNFGDGATGTGAMPAHAYTAPGTYNISLTITDANQATSAPSAGIVVISPLPVANPGGPYAAPALAAIQFDGSKSSSGAGLALTYAWSFGDGSSASGVGPSHSFAKAGVYSVSLTVTDSNLGSSAATAVMATVSALPVANAGGPYSQDVGLNVNLDGSKSSDPSGLALTYAWDFGDSSTGVGTKPSHIYATSGSYIVKLTATNSAGGASASQTTATIVSLPTADPGGPYAGNAGSDLAFDGSASKSFVADGVLTYDWHFGDSTPDAPSEFVKHNYPRTGSYTVTLSVTDTNGGTASSSVSATITSSAATSTCNFSLSGNNSALGTTQECTLTYRDGQGLEGRTFRIHIPANYVALNGNGAVYYLHGSGGTDSEGLTTGWVEKADAVGFLAVFPQAEAASSTGSTQWADYFSPAFTGTPPDDSTFLQQLIDHIEGNLFPGGKKVYVTGFSSGAYMSHRAAIDLADRIAAIAAFEGDLWESVAGATGTTVPQPAGNNPVAVVILNGDADLTVPYCGEHDSSGTSASIDDSFNYWAAANACTQIEPQTLCTAGVPSPLSVQGKTAGNCNNGADVVAYRLDAGTHRFYSSSVKLNVFPGSATAPYNPNFVDNPDGTNQVGNNSIDIAWNFFVNHPKL